MENAAKGGDFESPTLSFGLAQLPVGEGSFNLEIDMIDGEDGEQNDSERRVSAALVVNWISDGNSATFSLPEQIVNLTYAVGGGASFDVAMTNLDADIISVTSGGANYPDSLNVKLLSLLSKFDFVVPSSLLGEGDFYLNISTDIPLTNSVNERVTELRVWFSVASDNDGDGVSDTADAFPLDASETVDTDGDGIGNNADTDDDGDGVMDDADTFPLDSTRFTDTSGDGILVELSLFDNAAIDDA
jgi:hypothetical protein